MCLLHISGALSPLWSQEPVAPGDGKRQTDSPLGETLSQHLGPLIRHEMELKSIPGMAIALVDGERVVLARAFGNSSQLDTNEVAQPLTLHSQMRVGSVSKLFTDMAVMQWVEQGKLDLDADVRDYVPEFKPENPYGVPMTLRQLMSHRSGLVREPPVGNYFDHSGPSLQATVLSLNRTRLVHAPGTKTKYSNAGIAVVGYVLEKLSQRPFEELIEQQLLRPMGLERSKYQLTDALRGQAVTGRMWSYDGRQFDAPHFALGTSPAGNLYSDILDMGTALSALFAADRGNAEWIQRETLSTMLTPQAGGYGIGFRIEDLDGDKMIGHGGAVYGFSTQLHALPERQLGAVVIANLDVSNTLVKRICLHALRTLRALKDRQPLPNWAMTTRIDPVRARQLEGTFVHQQQQIELRQRNERLLLRIGSQTAELRQLGERWISDDVHHHGTVLQVDDTDHITIGDRRFQRIPEPCPAPLAESLRGLVGEYGWDHNVLFIYERQGQLYALIEWIFEYPLTPLTSDRFAFPNYGLYHDEFLDFERDSHGRAIRVTAAEVLFPRRPIAAETGDTFKIQPVQAIEQVRKLAFAATPPDEAGEFRSPQLTELNQLDPSIRLDIRYATTNNFMDAVFYQQARAFLQKPAAEALVRAHQSLKQRGYGLLIHDAYRPWFVTKMFWEATPAEQKIFVANPANGSRHNRGCAVDLTLYDLATGQPIAMGAGYDEFSERSFPDYPVSSDRARWHRELLRDAMENHGFTIYEYEWWHFDYRDWKAYPILNVPFEELNE